MQPTTTRQAQVTKILIEHIQRNLDSIIFLRMSRIRGNNDERLRRIYCLQIALCSPLISPLSYSSRIVARRIFPLDVFKTVCGGPNIISSGGIVNNSVANRINILF